MSYSKIQYRMCPKLHPKLLWTIVLIEQTCCIKYFCQRGCNEDDLFILSKEQSGTFRHKIEDCC